VKKIAVGLLVVMLVASSFVGFSPVNAANFSDVPKTHQYYKYITKLADAGIVKGRSTTQYAPNANLSRAELATLLVNLKKLPLETSKQYFNDVKPGTWYYGYVNAAAKAGLVAGYGDGTYRPNNPVTRAELAVVGLRGLGVTQATIDQYAKNPIYLSSDESKYNQLLGEGMANSSHYAQVSSTLLEAAWQVNCCRQGSYQSRSSLHHLQDEVACKERRTAVHYPERRASHVVQRIRLHGSHEPDTGIGSGR